MTKGNDMKVILSIFVLVAILVTNASGQNSKPGEKTQKPDGSSMNNRTIEKKYKVTFIELGSVRCIPCQMMQPVMKSIKAKYGKEVNIVFHDVWTEAGAPYAKKYGIESIPTQVFLDRDGKEYFRHVGFFPEEELIKVLNQKEVK